MQWESSGSIGAGGSYRRPNFPLVCRVAESVIQVNHNAQDIEQRQRMSNLTVAHVEPHSIVANGIVANGLFVRGARVQEHVILTLPTGGDELPACP